MADLKLLKHSESTHKELRKYGLSTDLVTFKGGKAMSARLPDGVDVHVGKRIRMQRLVVGMSQEALADKLGLTFQQVQKYEKGTNRISAGRMHQISDALNVPITYLFEGLPAAKGRSGGMAIDPHIGDFLATKDGLALIMAFGAIDDADLRRSVVELVQKIAARK